MESRLLVAEDSPTQAEYLRFVLESEGYDVDLAANGQDALSRMRDTPPRLILSDVLMPEMDGIAFCRAVKADPDTRPIPFILLTQLDTPVSIALGLEAGADDFISKPFEEGYLLERIRRMVRGTAEPPPGSLLEKASVLLTERESALRDARDFVEHLVAASPGVVFQADLRDLALHYMSPNLQRILGYAPDDVRALQTFLDRSLHGEDRDTVFRVIQRLREGRSGQEEVEFRLRQRSGAYHWYYTVFRREDSRDGTEARVLGFILDITPRREAEARLQALNETLEQRVAERTAAAEQRAVELARSEEALRQSNDMLRATVDASPLATFAVDRAGNVQTWNQAAERIFGWSADDVLGRAVPIVPMDRVPEFQSLCRRVLAGEILTGVETRRQRRDGTLIDVSWSGAPLHDASGEPSGLLVVVADITERKLLEEQFRQAQKMEAIGRLAGGVAHDFNNMLAVIRGYSELLQGRPEFSEDARSQLALIQEASDRAARLTSQLLAFSRKEVRQPQVLLLNDIVLDMRKMLQRLIGEDVELDVRLEPGLGWAEADPGQMEQVVLNLAVNARDAMPAGGKLVLETRNVDLDEEFGLRHPSVATGPAVLLSVADTGCGMDAETRSRIFEPFFTTKEAGKGTGLGLATVYGVVQQSRGCIAVETEPGKGTTFRIYLPRVEPGAEREEAAATASSLSGRGEIVLVVEDESMVRELVREVLRTAGYRVLEATNPGEALHFCQRYEGRIHLVLTDVVMPAMSGRELAERLATLQPEIRVLYMSGYTDDEVLRHGVVEGDTVLIRKPFTSAELMRRVREVLDSW